MVQRREAEVNTQERTRSRGKPTQRKNMKRRKRERNKKGRKRTYELDFRDVEQVGRSSPVLTLLACVFVQSCVCLSFEARDRPNSGRTNGAVVSAG